jgi:DNA repair exonuclease SbcCD ATPase subunit
MKPFPFTIAALLGLSFSAAAQTKVNFNDHVLPIFRNACNNCHNPDKMKAGLDLTTFQGTMTGGESGASVKPGNAAGSLIYKLSTHAAEPTMPPKGKLSDAELKTLNDWIAGFALETANSKPVVAQKNNVESVVVSLTRPEGPAPMPGDLPLEPFVKTRSLGAVTTLAASPWAPIVAVGGQKQVLLYNVDTLDALGVLSFPEGFPNVLRFSRNAKVLIAGGGLGGKLGKVVMWDVTTGERIGVVGNETDAVLAADLSADHQFVAIGGSDKRVRIYQTKDGKATGLIKKHTEWVTAVTFSPDGKYLGTADRNGGIEIWETAAEPKPFNSLPGHKSAVSALAFMPGVLASGSEDGTIKLWSVKEGTETKSWNAHPGGVLWVDFTPDGRLVSCGRDKIAKVWDATGKALAATEAFNDIALRATMSNDRVVAADWTGAIRVYSIAGDKVNKVGELSANPPGIAEQIAASEKALADANASIPALQAALAAAEAAVKAERDAVAAKLKADIAAAEGRKAEAEKNLAAAKAAPELAAKKVAEISAQFDAAKQAVAKAEATLGETRKAAAMNEKVKAEQAAGVAQKRVEVLSAELAKLREARAKFADGTAEYAKANEPVQARKTELAKAEEAYSAAKQKVANSPTAPAAADVEAAKVARDEAGKKVEALRQQLQQAQSELSKAKGTMPKLSADAEKAIASASAEIAKLQTPPKSPAVPTSAPAKVMPDIAGMEKKLEKLNADLEEIRAERAKHEPGTPGFVAAQAKREALGVAIAEATAALEAARGTPAASPAAPEPLVGTDFEKALAKARNDLSDSQRRAVSAQAGIERWKRALLYQGVYNARISVQDKQAKYDDLIATAKDAFRQADLAKQSLADAEKLVAEAQKSIDGLAAQLAAAEKAVADKKAAVVDPKVIEAEIAELTKQQAALTAELTKVRAARDSSKEGTPEHVAAKAKREELRPKETSIAAAIEAAKAKLAAKPAAQPISPEMLEAVKKAQLDLKLASTKLPSVEKAVVDMKKTIEDAQKQIPELKARIPQLQAEGTKIKAQAEQGAVVLAKELQAAKAEMEKLRAQYDSAKNANKSASVAGNTPPQS